MDAMEEVARIIQDVLDTLASCGSFDEWACAPEDCGLPQVGERLALARDIALSASMTAARPDTSSLRWQ
jgi:hypothetical protein